MLMAPQAPAQAAPGAPEALVIRRVANEHAQRGARGKFVADGGNEVGITGAPKGLEVMIGWVSSIEREERSAHGQGLGGEVIDEVGSSSKRISPIAGGIEA
jgi:hypothetical protein